MKYQLAEYPEDTRHLPPWGDEYLSIEDHDLVKSEIWLDPNTFIQTGYEPFIEFSGGLLTLSDIRHVPFYTSNYEFSHKTVLGHVVGLVRVRITWKRDDTFMPCVFPVTVLEAAKKIAIDNLAEALSDRFEANRGIYQWGRADIKASRYWFEYIK